MNNLSNQELNEISGGFIKLTIGKWLVAGGIATFFIGAINGYLRPLTCSSDK